MKWNAWLLPLLLGSALGAVYVLPKAGDTAESAVKMELPGSTGGWSFEKYQASQDEIKTLGPETGFAKAICRRARPGEVTADGYLVPDHIDLSIVLSGSDLNSSIHRPERCMPAQGHRIDDSKSKDVTFHLSNGREFKTRCLYSEKPGLRDGVAVKYQYLTYYFFVGHDQITNDHLDRTLIDMKDRLVRGMDQRWAYVSASMMYGKLPWIENEVTETEADDKVRKFVEGFAENQVVWEQIKR